MLHSDGYTAVMQGRASAVREKLIPMDVGDVREGRKTGAISPKVSPH